MDNLHNKVTSKWVCVEHSVPQGSVLGPLMFLIYINDLSRTVHKIASPVLFADDTSILITDTDIQEFQTDISQVMNETIKWFQSNLLTLNYEKTHFLQLLTKNQNIMKIQIVASNTVITNVNSTKFLGITIGSSISWKEHVSDLTSKLNKACYAIRAIKPLLSLNVLRIIYFSYFHSIMSCSIIFWDNCHLSNNIFKIQKRIIRVMNNKSKCDSCQYLFNQMQILTLPSQYIFSLLIFVVKNRDLFLFNSEIHNINTHNNSDLHMPNTNLTIVQKGVLYSGSKIYNKLPPHIKGLSDDLKRFKSMLNCFFSWNIHYIVLRNFIM